MVISAAVPFDLVLTGELMASIRKTRVHRPPDDVPVADSMERKELERRYALLLSERFDCRWHVSYVGNKKVPIHNWFPYKEGFSSKLVEALISEFVGTKKVTLYDPFCGAGTTPATGKYLGLPSHGSDLLPLAVFVTRVKLRTKKEYNLPYLRKSLDTLKKIEIGEAKADFPDIEILPKAFTPKITNDILFFRDYIMCEENELTREFLLFGLMSILEAVSHTGGGASITGWRATPTT